MPQHITYKLFFSGIDGAGKTACADLLTARLASKYRIVRTGSHDFYLYFNGRKSLVAKRRLYTKSELLGSRLGHRFYGVFLLLNFVYKAITIIKVKRFTKPDLMIYEADAVLHPAAYITYHFPFTRYLSRKLRVGVLAILFGSKRSSVRVYLDVDPRTAMERINKRGTDGGSHENLKDLTQIKAEIDCLIDVAVDSGFEIFRVNTNARNLEDVACHVARLVERKMSNLTAADSVVGA
jgi:thymidylate kinase